MNPLFTSRSFTLLCTLVALCSVSRISAQWNIYQTPPLSINGKVKVLRKNDNTLVAVSGNVVYNSTNFGDTWKQVFPARINIRDVAFQKNTLWINDGTALYKSTDDGASWQKLNNLPITARSYIDALGVASADTLFLAIRDTFSLVSFDGGNSWQRKAKFDMLRTSEEFQCVVLNNAVFASDNLSGYKFDLALNKTVSIFGDRFKIWGVFNQKLFVRNDTGLDYYSLDGINWKSYNFLYGYPVGDDNGRNVYLSYNRGELYTVNDTLFKSNLPNNVADNRIKKVVFTPQLFNSVTTSPIVAFKDSLNFLVQNPINGIWKTTTKGASYARTTVDGRTLPARKLVKFNNRYFVSTAQGIFTADNNLQNWQLVNQGAFSLETDNLLFVDDKVMVANRQFPVISRDGGKTWSEYGRNNIQRIFKNDVGYMVDVDNAWYISKDTLKSLSFAGMGSPRTLICDKNVFEIESSKYTLINAKGELSQPRYVLSLGSESIRSVGVQGNRWFVLDTKGLLYKSLDSGQTWAATGIKAPAFDNAPVPAETPALMLVYGDTVIFNYLKYLRFASNRFAVSSIISGKEENGTFENAINDGDIHLVGANIWRRSLANLRLQTISGNVYFDANNNGRRDFNEVGVPNAKILTKPFTNLTIADSTGAFELLTDANFVDSVYTQLDNYRYYKLNPAGRSVEAMLQVDNGNLGVYLTPNVKDLEVKASANMSPRPGFNFTIQIAYRNVGTAVSNGAVRLRFDSYLSALSVAPTPISTLPQYLQWNYANLQPGEERRLKVLFRTALNAPLRYETKSIVDIIPLEVDTFLGNNVDTLTASVVGSYDPNDKQVAFPNGRKSPNVIDKTTDLVYTIRFQNTGNFRTDFVRVVDTLSDLLDASTLRVIDASHKFDLTIKNGKILIFNFDPLFLPDSITDEQGSHGFIKFSIRPKGTLTNADVIKNRAFIYFDFNPAIITNVTETRNVRTSVVDTPSVSDNLRVFPNPSGGLIHFSVKNPTGENGKVDIFALDGRLIMSTNVVFGETNALDAAFLPSGTYILRVSDGANYHRAKFVVNH